MWQGRSSPTGGCSVLVVAGAEGAAVRSLWIKTQLGGAQMPTRGVFVWTPLPVWLLLRPVTRLLLLTHIPKVWSLPRPAASVVYTSHPAPPRPSCPPGRARGPAGDAPPLAQPHEPTAGGGRGTEGAGVAAKSRLSAEVGCGSRSEMRPAHRGRCAVAGQLAADACIWTGRCTLQTFC